MGQGVYETSAMLRHYLSFCVIFVMVPILSRINGMKAGLTSVTNTAETHALVQREKGRNEDDPAQIDPALHLPDHHLVSFSGFPVVWTISKAINTSTGCPFMARSCLRHLCDAELQNLIASQNLAGASGQLPFLYAIVQTVTIHVRLLLSFDFVCELYH